MEALAKFEAMKRKHPTLSFAIWAGSFILGGIALFSALTEIGPLLNDFGGFKVFIVSLILLLVLLSIFVLTGIAGDRKLVQQSMEIQELQAGRIPPDTYQRYEQIEDRKITLGWIRFHPTLRRNEVNGEMLGAGPEILRAVFNEKVKWLKTENDWSNVVSDLIAKKFDVVATPIYDIKERREQVEFSSPIFYADIGIFVSRQNKKVHDAIHRQHGLTFPKAIDLLQEIDTLKLCVHKGELQDKMARKYLPNATVIHTSIDKFAVHAALDAMVEEDEEFESDLYFCERVLGEGHPLFGSEIVNILAPGQLLFPVAFAIRKGDDTLRKFINLRLMTIDGERGSGIMRMLIDSTSPILTPNLASRLDEYFLRERAPTDEGQKVVPLRQS